MADEPQGAGVRARGPEAAGGALAGQGSRGSGPDADRNPEAGSLPGVRRERSPLSRRSVPSHLRSPRPASLGDGNLPHARGRPLVRPGPGAARPCRADKAVHAAVRAVRLRRLERQHRGHGEAGAAGPVPQRRRSRKRPDHG